MERDLEFVARTRVDAPASELFAWHERPGALERLTPPWERFVVLDREGGIRDGDRLVARVGVVGSLGPKWVARHRDYVAGEQFVDEQERGPFSRWVHTHRVADDGTEGSVLEDRIEYRLPLGAIGRALGRHGVESKLERMFRYRHAITRIDLARHHRFVDRPRMTIAITGASGLVGRALTPFLTLGGHRVVPLVRRSVREGEDAISWHPERGEIDARALEGVDAVVHLAGDNVASGRWTDAKKRRIRESRVAGTTVLAEALATLARPPRVLVSASAVGFYGDAGDAWVDESAPRGDGFLAEVCGAWEDATAPAADAGVRVVHLRIGIVLARGGGALAKMLLPHRLGLGGPLGDGRAYVSFISIDDLVGAIHHALFDERLVGPVNATAPAPVTHEALSHALARALHRPALFRVPAFALRAALGREMANETVLSGARVRPAALVAAGFEHAHPNIPGALAHVLGTHEGVGDAERLGCEATL